MKHRLRKGKEGRKERQRGLSKDKERKGGEHVTLAKEGGRRKSTVDEEIKKN